MSAINFVVIAAVLAFTTGFFVAAIIWGISWAISPKEEKTTISGFMKVFNSYYKPKFKEEKVSVVGGNLMATEETKNKELYKFYHGKN